MGSTDNGLDFQAQFQGKVALVTGAASGIGEATALAFARAGAAVLLADVQREKAEAVAATIRAEKGRAVAVACDVSQETEVKSAIDRCIREWGRLDVAFNNAGTEGAAGLLVDGTDASFDRTFQVNVKGVWYCMKHQIPIMLRQGEGAIINCASIAGVVGFPGASVYTASKHAVIGLTKAAALEYAKQGVRINAVCPGVIQTPMIDRFTHGEASALQQLAGGEPVGRLGKPEEIASAVLWLASSGARFVTGHPLVVDGGWVAQ